MAMSHRQRFSFSLVLLVAAVGSIILLTNDRPRSSASPSLRIGNHADQSHRQLIASLAQFTDPKSVSLRSDAPLEARAQREVEDSIPRTADGAPREQFAPIDHESRKNCQIIYITGVEGATHHGFIPIIEALAKAQVDPETGLGYHVDAEPESLKAGLFGWFYGRKIRKIGRAHV